MDLKFILASIVISIVVVTGIGIVVVQQSSPAVVDIQKQLPSAESTQIARAPLPQPTVLVEGGPVESPLSLSVFAQKKFNGRNLTVGRVLAENESYTRYYITYLSGDLTISGIMNVPKGDGPFPVLILNHGYIDPAIYTNGRGLKREQDYLARREYIVIHPDYRNHAESSKDATSEEKFRLGYVEDVINVIYAVRDSSLPYFDKERIGMLGHSMGGGVAQTIAVTRPDLLKAIVLFAPVSSDIRDNFEKWTRSRPEVVEKIIAAYGAPADNPEFWDSISPRSYVDKVTVPIMIHHGTNDESVPLDWSEVTTDAFKAAGKDVTLHIYPGEPHEFIDAWGTVMQRTVQFFDSTVKK